MKLVAKRGRDVGGRISCRQESLLMRGGPCRGEVCVVFFCVCVCVRVLFASITHQATHTPKSSLSYYCLDRQTKHTHHCRPGASNLE